MGIHKGTKLTDNPKDQLLRVRIDKDMMSKLDIVCAEKEKTRSEVVRDGIEQQYIETQK